MVCVSRGKGSGRFCCWFWRVDGRGGGGVVEDIGIICLYRVVGFPNLVSSRIFELRGPMPVVNC
jgi:hypothetical protein